MSVVGQHERYFQEHLLHAGADAAGRGGSSFFPWLLVLGLAILTFNAVMAVCRSNGDRGAVAFIVLSYVDLVLLFCCCLQLWSKRAEPGSATRGKVIKMAVGLLATALTIAFSYKVAATMPDSGQVVVWVAMAGATILGGLSFFVLFLHMKQKKGLLAVLGSVTCPAIRLIADTAASMHAVGDRRLLGGLELYTVPEWVTLPNGTLLRILGIGSIELEHFSIPNVYLVEGFQKCLISMSQLDRDHGMYSCFGSGIARIMLTDGTQVGGAILDENDGMYVLSYLEVPSPTQD